VVDPAARRAIAEAARARSRLARSRLLAAQARLAARNERFAGARARADARQTARESPARGAGEGRAPRG